MGLALPAAWRAGGGGAVGGIPAAPRAPLAWSWPGCVCVCVRVRVRVRVPKPTARGREPEAGRQDTLPAAGRSGARQATTKLTTAHRAAPSVSFRLAIPAQREPGPLQGPSRGRAGRRHSRRGGGGGGGTAPRTDAHLGLLQSVYYSWRLSRDRVPEAPLAALSRASSASRAAGGAAPDPSRPAPPPARRSNKAAPVCRGAVQAPQPGPRSAPRPAKTPLS